MRDETQCHNLPWIVCTEMLSTENLFSMINQSTNLVFHTRNFSTSNIFIYIILIINVGCFVNIYFKFASSVSGENTKYHFRNRKTPLQFVMSIICICVETQTTIKHFIFTFEHNIYTGEFSAKWKQQHHNNRITLNVVQIRNRTCLSCSQFPTSCR